MAERSVRLGAKLAITSRNFGRGAGAYDIRVNAIARVFFGDKTTEQLFGGREYVNEMTQEMPAGHFATAEKLVNAASFLVSDYANYVTGATLTIEGGESLNKGFLRFAETFLLPGLIDGSAGSRTRGRAGGRRSEYPERLKSVTRLPIERESFWKNETPAPGTWSSA